MALQLSIPISNTSLTQQGTACYVIKLNSKSFRVRSNFGVAFAQAKAAGAVSSLRLRLRLRRSQSQGARGGPIPGKIFRPGK